MENDDQAVNWEDLGNMLVKASQELARRDGSFADGPFAGIGDDEVIREMWPVEDEAVAGMEAWIEGKEVPVMSPTANRFAEVHFKCAGWMAYHLDGTGACCPRPGDPIRSALRWLLIEVSEETTRPALDAMRYDLSRAFSEDG